ncbi:MAG TPA: L-2-hydroxyglutarate oxidase, partial [Nitrospiraceae bacterium]|nr:L-2-hydroxyglutarate oxidase [Nitrospiraceae bacterium]
GGGVIGCALAMTLATRFKGIAVLDKERAPGLHASGRNSGVVHSGFNPKPGTLKARLCVEGNRRLAEYAQANGVSFRRVGTFVIARNEAEVEVLKTLHGNGEANGVPGIEMISGESLRRFEPNALGEMALYAPTGGIIDSATLVRSLADSARKMGVEFLLGHHVTGVREQASHVELVVGGRPIVAEYLVNCAGLYADRLAHRMGVGRGHAIIPFRGEYYAVEIEGAPLIRSMIYPAPDLAFPFLGVHVTATVAGPVIIGPNAVPAFGREAYSRWAFHPGEMLKQALWKGTRRLLQDPHVRRTAVWELRRSFSRRIFASEAAEVVRGIVPEALRPYRPGIRAQLVREDGKLIEDMLLEQTPRSLHLLNVISPGMTCSIPFSEHVAGMVTEALA